MSDTLDSNQQTGVFNAKAELFLSKYLLFAAVPFACLMLYLGFLGTRNFMRAQKTESWPTTVGKMTKVELERGKDSLWTAVEYAYDVDGKAYTGHRVSHTRASTGYGNAQSFKDAHPASSEITVYYNRDRPQEAILVPGADVMAHLFVTFPIFMVLLTFSTILSAMRYNGFVGLVASGDLASIKEACYKMGYGQTPMRALLVAAQRPDDAILKEVIKGAARKEREDVIAYCRHMGFDEAYAKLMASRSEDTPETAVLERKKNVKAMVKPLLWLAPFVIWVTYVVLTKKQ